MRSENNDDEPYRESLEAPLAPELAELAASLAALAPAAARLDRDRLMYEAGRRAATSVRRQPAAWLWPLSTAALALVSLGLAGALMTEINGRTPLARDVAPMRPQEPDNLAAGAAGGARIAPTEERPRAERVAIATPPAIQASLAAQSYFKLREAILSRGVESLPLAPLPSAVKMTPYRWRDGRQGLLGG